MKLIAELNVATFIPSIDVALLHQHLKYQNGVGKQHYSCEQGIFIKTEAELFLHNRKLDGSPRFCIVDTPWPKSKLIAELKVATFIPQEKVALLHHYKYCVYTLRGWVAQKMDTLITLRGLQHRLDNVCRLTPLNG